jgi:hypothetical protein
MTIPEACLNCDADTWLSEQGLCHRCRDELRFVVRPAAHRDAYRRRVAAEAGLRDQLERFGVVVISSVPDDNSLWLCDLCNTQIPVAADHTLIPLLGGHALCIPCVSTLPFWPDGWTHPTPRACACAACQTPLLQLPRGALRREALERERPDRGLER